jgi:hypothetical protein
MFTGNLAETNLDAAYQFSSFSPYIINGGLNSRFSPNCIFCSSNNSINLANDGSFKQCNSCKKQFKAQLANNNQANQQLHYFPPYRVNT